MFRCLQMLTLIALVAAGPVQAQDDAPARRAVPTRRDAPARSDAKAQEPPTSGQLSPLERWGRLDPEQQERMRGRFGRWQKLSVEERERPVPGPGEALVQVTATGICGSDVHGYTGETGLGPRLNPPRLAQAGFIEYLRNPRNPRRMPPYQQDDASDQKLADIYAYLDSLPSASPDADSIPLLRAILDEDEDEDEPRN